MLADALGLSWAIGAVGGLTLVSGVIVALVMYALLPPVIEPADLGEVAVEALERRLGDGALRAVARVPLP